MALAKKGMTSNVGACIGQAALYDENVLSRSAVRGKLDDLPSEVVRAATRDLDVLMDAAATSPEDLLDDFCSHGILESAVANRPPTMEIWTAAAHFVSDRGRASSIGYRFSPPSRMRYLRPLPCFCMASM